jgi:hypothetical protein
VIQIPIACTLSAGDRTTRGDAWHQFLETNVAEIIRTETSARMRLNAGDEALVSAVDLARREKVCCAFFEFQLEILPDALWLAVRSPAEGSTILDALIDTGRT